MTPSNSMTLSEFFAHVYRPFVLVDASPRTIQTYAEELRTWKRLTGDPPLTELDGQDGQRLLFQFRATLLELPTRFGTPRSINTVNKTLRHVRALFLKAGPRGWRTPEAFGLIGEPPHVRMLKAQKRYFKRLTLAELDAIYEAIPQAVYMPRLAHLDPADWWRAFVVVAYGTGLRLSGICGSRVEDIDWNEATLLVRGDKTYHERPKPLRPEVAWHLKQIVSSQSNGGLLFPWPHRHGAFVGRTIPSYGDASLKGFCISPACRQTIHNTLHKHWGRILKAAGLERHVTIHDLRRTSASMIAGAMIRAIGAAGAVLDHSGYQVTADFYIDTLDLEREAVAAMPWPESMKGGAA